MKKVELEILTPSDMFYQGEIESLVAETVCGSEGYLADHVWCRKLLKDEGLLKIREAGSKQMKTARIYGGYVEIREKFTVYTENAQWE